MTALAAPGPFASPLGGARRSPRRRPWIFRPALPIATFRAALPEPEPAPIDAAPIDAAPDAAADAPADSNPDAAPDNPPADDPAATSSDSAPPPPSQEELQPWLSRAIDGELEASHKVGSTALSWQGPIVITRFPHRAPPGGGVYIVIDGQGRPLYVGEAQDFSTRWHGRLQAIDQIGLTSDDGRLPQPVRVYFGTLPAQHAARADLRKGVEHAVVRTLVNAGLAKVATSRAGSRSGQLRNALSIRPFRADGGLTVAKILPDGLRPKGAFAWLAEGTTLRLKSGQSFER
jgi:hypothetical protein